MESRRASGLARCTLAACAVLLACEVLPVLAANGSEGSAPAPHPHVTARPPLQVIPAAPAGAGSVQQRMRQCNVQADTRKLRDGARETFVKSCMAARSAAK